MNPSNQRVVFPGSFDPLTLGHLDLIQRASGIFKELIVAVVYNPNKTGFFPIEERKQIIAEVLQKEGLSNVRVDAFSGLLVDYLQQVKATAILKGLRNIKDFESEMEMAHMNFAISHGISTLFMMTKPEYSYISSSLVREVAKLKGNVSAHLHPLIYQKLLAKL